MSSTTHEPLAERPRPDWQPDPTGRHQYRYFDGVRWTDHVADHGRSTKDPYALPPPPPGPRAPAAAPPDPALAPAVPPGPARVPAVSQDATVPTWARSADTLDGADATEPKPREVYGSGTWDFVFVLLLCLLFPFVSLWYGPKLLFTGHVLRGLIVLAVTAVWFSMLTRML